MSIHFINPIDSIEFAITLTREKKNRSEEELQREIAFLVIYALVARILNAVITLIQNYTITKRD